MHIEEIFDQPIFLNLQQAGLKIIPVFTGSHPKILLINLQ